MTVYHYVIQSDLILNSDQIKMEGNMLVQQFRKLISLVDLLRDINLQSQLSLPKIVVLGTQSSGKSSLLEQIVGLDFLPRGTGVVTRRPLELRMNRIPDLQQPYAQFDEVIQAGKKKMFTNFNEVRKMIGELTDKVCGSKQIIKDIPIVLNIFSANCPNLTIVDLPGITLIPVGDQPQNIYQITKNMALRYIKELRSIILCVIPANQDMTTNEALQVMRQIDPKGERSIGCLTKIDIMNRGDDATKMLRNLEVPLRYGYVGVKNRCQEDVSNNVPVSHSLKTEIEFFTTNPVYATLPRDLFSTESLTKKMTNILYQQIKTNIPAILEEIKKKRLNAEEQLRKLGAGIGDSDQELMNYAWRIIANFIKEYTNSIHGIKNSGQISNPISSEIREQLNNLYKEQFDYPATENLDDKDIHKAMMNFQGDSTIPGFPSIDAFLALLNPLMTKLQSPAYSLSQRIHQLMENQADKIASEVMVKKFPQFNRRFTDLIRRILEKHRKQLDNYLTVLMNAEISYLYTNDETYLMGDFTITDKERRKIQTGKIKDPLIFELRKRIDSYFKLVVRNLRDLVPKQIIYFLIEKCTKQLEFEAFQFTADPKKLKEWLNQPQQVRSKRQQLIQAIKIFDESSKRIRMDPEISKLIQDSKNDKKIIKTKSPQTKSKCGKSSEKAPTDSSQPHLRTQPESSYQTQGQTNINTISPSTSSGSNSNQIFTRMTGSNVVSHLNQPIAISRQQGTSTPPATGPSGSSTILAQDNDNFSQLWMASTNVQPSNQMLQTLNQQTPQQSNQQQNPLQRQNPLQQQRNQQPQGSSQGQRPSRTADFAQLFGVNWRR